MAKKSRSSRPDESTVIWTDDPAEALRVGTGFALADLKTSATPGIEKRRHGRKKAGRALLNRGTAELSDLQEKLWAESRFGSERRVLLVLQAMDTAGKGGIVRHVIGGVDPQGVRVFGFKKPTEAELSHDFLWRIRRELPSAGHLGVFDRSHYEDVLVTRVHDLVEPDEITERYAQINEFEHELVQNGTTIVKVMLHISPSEQRERLTERLDRPEKHWKFNPGDIDERAFWPDYQAAYQAALAATSTEAAPWFVVPADRKWYARVAVQHLLIDAMRGLELQWPVADFDVAAERARLTRIEPAS